MRDPQTRTLDPYDHSEAILQTVAAAVKSEYPDADEVLYRMTGWPSVIAMLRTATDPRYRTYRPTCRISGDGFPVADIWDAAMAALDDPRRAERVL